MSAYVFDFAIKKGSMSNATGHKVHAELEFGNSLQRDIQVIYMRPLIVA